MKGALRLLSFPVLFHCCDVPCKAAGSSRDGKVCVCECKSRQEEKKELNEMCTSLKSVLKEGSELE